MPVLERVTVENDGEVVSTKERKLYTLAELKEGKQIEGRDIVEAHVASAFERACEDIARMKDETGWTSSRLEEEISEYIVPEILAKAGITTDVQHISWDVSPVQGGMFFALDPAHTKVDAKVFLRAMQMYFAGKDWRGREYAKATQKPRLPSGKAIKQIDLRSSDAWHARRDGVYMQIVRQSMWAEELEIEPGYDYEHDFSDEFMADCNDFLSEVTGFALRTLRDAAENEHDEEQLLSDAELNEWRFDEEGRPA